MTDNIEEKKGIKGSKIAIILTVIICIVLLVAGITVVLAGVVFLWGQSFTDDSGGTVETVNVKADITYSTGPPMVNTLTFDIMSGSVDWSKYEVRVDGVALPASTDLDHAGDSESFTWTPTSNNVGETLNVKIINIEEYKVVWERDIIVKSS